MDYRKPTTNPLRDAAGNETADFTGFEVDNNSTVDGIPPEPASAEVPEAGSSLTLTFNEDLDRTAAVPPPGAFTVKADGDTVTVQSVALGTDPDQLVFDLGDRCDQAGPDGHGGLRGARDQSHPGCRRQRSRGVHRLRGRQQFQRGRNPAGPGERRGAGKTETMW